LDYVEDATKWWKAKYLAKDNNEIMWIQQIYTVCDLSMNMDKDLAENVVQTFGPHVHKATQGCVDETLLMDSCLRMYNLLAKKKNRRQIPQQDDMHDFENPGVNIMRWNEPDKKVKK